MKYFSSLLCALLLVSGCTPKEVKLVDQISKSTVLVRIKAHTSKDIVTGTCGGVVISPHEILLANHCVNPPEDIKISKIWVKDYFGKTQEASVEVQAPEFDLALLWINNPEIPAKVASAIRAGETCFVVGHPLGIEWVASKGIVSRVDLQDRSFKDATFFVTDATVLPGNSGGGVWNTDGELIGIVSMSTSVMGVFGASGLGIIVDISSINTILQLT